MDALLFRECLAAVEPGCEVTACVKYEDAEKALSDQEFDLVVTDQNIGGTHTDHPAISLRAAGWVKPIVAMSGNPDPLPSYRAGATAFVKKPSDIGDYERLMRALVAFVDCFWRLTEGSAGTAKL